jgi:hypothetical protein
MMILMPMVLRNNSCYRKGGNYYAILGMDDLAEQFSGMIKRNLNPIRHSGENRKRYLVTDAFKCKII